MVLLPAGPAQASEEALQRACGKADAALTRAAREVARRRVAGTRVASAEELTRILRESGSTAPWPRSLVFVGPQTDQDALTNRVRTWSAGLPSRLPRRCGVASATDDRGSVALAVVAAPVGATLQPIPARVRESSWVTIDGQLLVPATGARVVLIGPAGLPRTMPASFTDGHVVARFSADHPGRWLAQLVADLNEGPLPVAEIELQVGEPAQARDEAPGEAEAGPDEEASLALMVNNARLSEGLAPLPLDPALSALARAHSARMAERDLVAHDAGDGDPEKRLESAQIAADTLGENVAHGATVAASHRLLWWSPSHRLNLLSPRFTSVGIGITRGRDGTAWVTQLFLRRPAR
jgi:uncharacterized protein YkwD